MKIFIIGALPSSLINFRGELIRDFVANGHQITAMASNATNSEIVNIEKLGVKYIDYPVQRNGLNPFTDISTLYNFIKIFKIEKPDIVLSYTIKPVIWGGIAASFFSNIKFYGLITGLGFAFQKGGVKRSFLNLIATSLYRLALFNSSKVIFQNPDNMQVFITEKIVTKDNAVRVNGSGVCLNHYYESALPPSPPMFLTIARLLGEKGLREFAAAAKIVKIKHPESEFKILGPEDPSPDGIPLSEVKSWNAEGYITYLGEATDVRPFINDCHVFVLASYHEGMPRTVLEAMAIGRPILTTNVPGCKETVKNGENGFLVEKANVDQLVEKMCWFIDNLDKLPTMAEKSHALAKEYYDVQKVNHELMKIMELK
jgi:glycosyltransferase involved in cell wall biosynthesis